MRSVRIPAYGLHKATGQARVCIDGRDLYLGPYGSDESKREYDRLVTRWKTQRTARRSARLTVGQLVLLFDAWAEDYYQKHGRPTGEAALCKLALRPVVQKHSRTAVSDFGPLALKACRQAMVDQDLARSTVNQHTRRICRMFAWGVAEELVPPDVLVALRAVPGLRKGRTKAREPEPVKPVPEASINAVLPFLSRQVADMVRLQLLTGCRPGEICQLRPCDLNRDGDVWEFVPQEFKTEHHEHRGRMIFFGPRAQAILEQWIDNRPAEAFCFSPREAEAERRMAMRAARKTPVQPSQQNRRKAKPVRPPGERYDTVSYRKAIHRACRQAKVAIWSPNQLRHARATDLRRRYGIEAPQVILGHTEISTTQIYAERNSEAARKIMSEVG